MPTEIEKKFLLKNDNWRDQVKSSRNIRQGYLGSMAKASVRIRLDGDNANINIKSADLAMVRQEYEYPVPVDQALEMLETLCESPQVDKIRHLVDYAGHTWEIDEFFGDNAGLVVAEIELNSEDEDFEIPEWLGEEVTDDGRYYNVNLVQNPYKNWAAGTSTVR